MSIVAVNDDTVSASVRDDDAASWTDVGSFERAHIWSDPYRAAGLTVLYLLGAMTIVLVLWIPIASDRLAAREPQPGRLVLRVVTVIGAAGLLVAFVAGARARTSVDPYRAAGLTILYLLGAMTIVLVLWIPIAGDRLAAREPQPGRLLLRVVTVIGAVGLLVAFVAGAPTLAFVAVVLPFAFLLFYLVKWLPDEITSTGQLLDYIFSPKRREPFLRDQAARDAQAIRGAALEKALDDVKDEWSGRAD